MHSSRPIGRDITEARRRSRLFRYFAGACAVTVATALVLSILAPARGWFQLEKVLSRYQQAEKARADAENSPRNSFEDSLISYPTSRQMLQNWNSALMLLETDKTDEALDLLQEILESDEDSYLLNDRRRPLEGAISLKGAVRDVLEHLSADLRETYELKWGADADRLWEEYQKSRSKAILDELVRRYPATRSGLLARERLAAWYFDREEPIAAARLYEGLWRSPHLANERRRPVAILAAAGWYRGGQTDRAATLLVDAGLVDNAAELTLGGEVVEPIADREQIAKWLEQNFGPGDSARPSTSSAEEGAVAVDDGPENWLLINGTPERNASGPMGNPLWEPSWSTSALLWEMSGSSAKTEYLQSVWDRLKRKNVREGGLPVPTTMPLIVGDHVVYRTINHVGAVHLSSGESAWETIVIDPAADVLIDRSMKQRVVPNSGQTPIEKLLINRAWQNQTSASISSDGEFVFVLDDMGYLRSDFEDRRLIVDPLAARGYNRLLAFDIQSGKLRWEVGDGRSEVELPFAGMAFLGPPLAVGGELYCLVQDSSEQLLVVLDPATGERLWELSLLSSFQIPAGSIITPLDGLSPSLADGILVCPSGFGAVTAVDITRRELLWSFTDDTAMNLDRLAATDPRFIRQFPPQAIQLPWKSSANWLDGLPVIEKGRVLLTIPGSRQLSCVSLADGELLWSLPHENGLYVGGVADDRVLIVDRQQLRCHWLEDGSPAWEAPLPLDAEPCGRGVRSGLLYQLPVEGNEVLHINLVDGRIMTRVKLSDKIALGNLVGAAGVVVSQTPDRVTAFQPHGELRRRVESALAQNPDDADALALRGELRLSLGAEKAGLEDLRNSLKQKPTPRAQERLVTALTEGLRSDFDKYREFRDEVEPYLDTARLRWDYLTLYADGLKRNGDNVAAFAEYLSLVQLAGDRALEADNDDTLATPPASWIRSRLSDVYGTASPSERAEFDGEIEKRWEAVSRSDDPQVYAQFARNFSYHPLASQALRRSVELGKAAMSPIERELHLSALTHSDDPATAGYAYAEWTRLLLDRQRYEETGYLFDILEHRFADVECYPGKTGAALAIAWKLEVSKAGASPTYRVHWPTETIEVSESPRPQDGRRSPFVAMAFDGDPGPFFSNWTIEIDHEQTQLRANNPLGQVVWTLPLEEVQFLVPQYLTGMTVKAHNHLLIVNLIHGFLVIDTLEERNRPKVLWQQSLLDPAADPAMNAGLQTQIRIRAGGLRRAQFFDGRSPLGQVGPMIGERIHYQVGRELVAARVLTGEASWTRKDVPAGSQLFGRDDILVAATAQPSGALVLDAHSGMLIRRTSIPQEYEQLHASGQTMLCWKKIDSGYAMYLLDLVSDETVWEQQFESIVSIWLVDDTEVAVMTPKGKLTVYRIADGGERFSHSVELQQSTLVDFLLLKRADGYLLLTNTAPPANATQRTFNDMESRTVNGPVCSFDRDTGKLLWQAQIDYQAYNVTQPDSLPVAVFYCRRYDPESLKKNDPRGQFAVQVLNLRTGITVYEQAWSELRGMVVITPEYDRKRIILDASLATIVLQFN